MRNRLPSVRGVTTASPHSPSPTSPPAWATGTSLTTVSTRTRSRSGRPQGPRRKSSNHGEATAAPRASNPAQKINAGSRGSAVDRPDPIAYTPARSWRCRQTRGPCRAGPVCPSSNPAQSWGDTQPQRGERTQHRRAATNKTATNHPRRPQPRQPNHTHARTRAPNPLPRCRTQHAPGPARRKC